jgi:hypothetical protein
VLEIGVRLPADFASPGAWLAEAQALEAAGAGWLWVESPAEGPSPWPLLGGLAVATVHCRLGLLASKREARDAADLVWHARSLDAFSGGRFALGLPAEAPWKDLVGRLESAGVELPLLLRAAGPAPDCPSRALAVPGTSPDELETLAGGLPEPAAESEAWTVWVELDAPEGRTAWREVLAGYEAAGAAGLIVAHDARLLDLLRNPDKEDDRPDLQLAQG